MLILLGIRKSFDKIQYPFIMKVLVNLGIKEAYLTVIMTIFNKSTTYIMIEEKRLKYFH